MLNLREVVLFHDRHTTSNKNKFSEICNKNVATAAEGLKKLHFNLVQGSIRKFTVYGSFFSVVTYISENLPICLIKTFFRKIIRTLYLIDPPSLYLVDTPWRLKRACTLYGDNSENGITNVPYKE